MRRSILSLALVLSGCSVVVGDLKLPHCSHNEECQVLNDMNGIASDACALYQCHWQDDVCELTARDGDRDGLVAPECISDPIAAGRTADCNDAVAGGTEVCNGIDDDCDGIIDEHFVVDMVASNPLPAEPAAGLIAGASFSSAGTVGYGTGSNAFAVAYTEGNSGSYGIVSGASATSPTPMGYVRDTAYDMLQNTVTLISGCVSKTPSAYRNSSCNFGDADLGLTDDNVFAAVVNVSGCGAGQVRVGHFPRGSSMPGQLIQLGPPRRSDSFAGIDVADNLCTGASRSSGIQGAASPSIATLELSGPDDQALAAWIADSSSRASCSADAADVEILGLFVQHDAFGNQWTTGTNEGLQQVIGRTTQGGRPGIAAWDNTGYIVGFADPAGGIHLVFVAQPGAPPAFTTGPADDRTGLEVPPLTTTDLGTIPTDTPAEDVVLTVGSILTSGIEVGIAWREGCGSGSETIHFREIVVASDGSAIDEGHSFDPIVLTPSPAPSAGPPAITFTFSGMIEQGVTRMDGRATGTQTNDGGWVVAWADTSNQDPGPQNDANILARRISEADGQILSPDEVLMLNAPGDVERHRPVLYTDSDDRVSYGFLALGMNSGFRGAALTCVPQ